MVNPIDAARNDHAPRFSVFQDRDRAGPEPANVKAWASAGQERNRIALGGRDTSI
jgi:hypothetical protein